MVLDMLTNATLMGIFTGFGVAIGSYLANKHLITTVERILENMKSLVNPSTNPSKLTDDDVDALRKALGIKKPKPRYPK